MFLVPVFPSSAIPIQLLNEMLLLTIVESSVALDAPTTMPPDKLLNSVLLTRVSLVALCQSCIPQPELSNEMLFSTMTPEASLVDRLT